MTVLLDASVLVPLFVRDALTPRAFTLVGRAAQPLLVSDWAALETISAFSLKARTGAISISEAEVARDNLHQWRRDFGVAISLEPSDVQNAIALLGAFQLNLRAPDALHLAMAQRVMAPLATFDAKLAAAGRSVGIAVAP